MHDFKAPFVGYQAGQMVYFWTGRGSQGYATITRVEDQPRRGTVYFLEPEPDAIKGADYFSRSQYWAPRNRGVLLSQLDTRPRIWFENF